MSQKIETVTEQPDGSVLHLDGSVSNAPKKDESPIGATTQPTEELQAERAAAARKAQR